MLLIDKIKNENLIVNNDIEIEEAIYNKNTKVLNIYFVLDYAISYNNYLNLYNFIDKLLKDIDSKIINSISIGYKDETLSREELMEYLNAIYQRLCNENVIYKSLNMDDVEIDGANISFVMPNDSLGLDELCAGIDKEFMKYGLLTKTNIIYDENKSIQKEIDEFNRLRMLEIEREQNEAMEAKIASEALKKINKDSKRNYYNQYNKIAIKDIPHDSSELSMFENDYGSLDVEIVAYSFFKEIKPTNKNPANAILTLKVTDDTDSIIVKKWVKTESEEKTLYDREIKDNTELKITGTIEYDSFAKDIVVKCKKIEIIGVHEENLAKDEEINKRVELAAHTKMSTLDAIVEPSDYLKVAKKWGWNTMAFTDTSGLYAIPDIDHSIKDDFKPIYGVELNFINDDEYFITFDSRDIDLRNATFTVFDIETTGLTQMYDTIIEIAACRVEGGKIVGTFDELINPLRDIPPHISNLTHITNDMVRDCATLEDILPKFLEFAKDSILVAHNAKFDIGVIYYNIKKMNIDYPVLPVIDTLNLYRGLAYNEVKRFNLESLAKYYKVKQESYHRAYDDTRVLAECFLNMIGDLYSKEIYNYKDINSLINKDVFYKLLFPTSINLLAKNKIGYRNMVKIVSDSLTVHLAKDARCLKSVLEENREGLLVGSGNVNGDIFRKALEKNDDDLIKAMEYYDYIEVQPKSSFRHLYYSLPNGEKDIEDVIIRIINCAKKLNKIVVATSDCHYLRPIDKQYRDILIAAPLIGGGTHHLFEYKERPDSHLRTTSEMLIEFNFLDSKLAHEIVIENTNKIADMIERYPIFAKELFCPRDDEFKDNFLHVPSIVEEMKNIVYSNLAIKYGDNPHPIIKARIDRELNSIIGHGYASVYYMSYILVKKSLDDGYLVGSRGSVGSSLVATMMNITEINPLKPHYYCKKCHFHTLKMTNEEKELHGMSEYDKAFDSVLQSKDDGYDLPDMICPICGSPLSKDGHDIPFETFLGFNGDKTPDIDLNFSGDYQPNAHEYIREVFGKDNAFRAGTVGTVAENTAFGYVQGYIEKTNVKLRRCEIERLSKHIVGVKRSTGQHPGGIVVVPHNIEIYDVTPVQYPADNNQSNWRTTHYDYHKFENNLLKLDILGHDDPTMIKFLMDYVNKHPEDFPFSRAQDIPVDDPKVYKLFYSTDSIGLTPRDISSKIASFAIPEFGTKIAIGMLVETLPKSFAELVKIAGLAHGTNVWSNNAQNLVNGTTEYGTIEFKDIIGCRDDIMVDLIRMGLDPLKSFKIMEFVRKNNKVKDPETWVAHQQYMRENNVPEWYIWSCGKIEYMFPKAHAAAYVLMALRIAWFKVNAPLVFYSGWFSKRAKAHEIETYVGGVVAIRNRLAELLEKNDKSNKEDDLITSMQVALEMTLRGYKFLPLDINLSEALDFKIEENGLRVPFASLDKLGESVALDIVERRNEEPFKSKADVKKRTKLNQTLYDTFVDLNVFNSLNEEDAQEATTASFGGIFDLD